MKRNSVRKNIVITMAPDLQEGLDSFFSSRPEVKKGFFYADAIREKLAREEAKARADEVEARR